jgi:lipopolysaccharide transport system ATP-binding protein
VSFAVAQCETVGIIGRNGSGKSTLLQLICGTLTPSEGLVETRGRVAALLELGSGFNPEFTGLENVYLNASLLGLSNAQVDERLEDILAFADIGAFVHQPVKTYSSGMTVRLSFAVIAHVDADILIVDEALAVGDAYFTQKCMRFIHRYREHGSLLFVSHDTTAITGICDRAILLDSGQVSRVGPAKEVSEHYGRDLYEATGESNRDGPVPTTSGVDSESSARPTSSLMSTELWRDYRTDRINRSHLAKLLESTQFEEALQRSESFGNGGAILVNVVLSEASTGLPLRVGLGGECVILRIEGQAHRDIAQPIIGFILKNDKGLVLLGDNTNNVMDSYTVNRFDWVLDWKK